MESRKPKILLPTIQKSKSAAININSPNSRALSRLWNDLVNAKRRMETEGPFLLRHLTTKGCRQIFDSCIGTGADSIYLLKKGYSVVSNELDVYFVARALVNARSNSVELNISNYDWRVLDKLVGEGSFGAVMCLGNSLTYLHNHGDQINALKGFLHVLQSGGVLIADTRNYDYMLDKREEILGNGRFRYSGRYVYCGMDRVRAFPLEISDDEITMEYQHLQSGETGNLVLYPFRLSELRGLLEEAGFTEITLFSDYKEGFNPEADFYQFVCTKP